MFEKIKLLFIFAISLPKTIYFNLRYLPFKQGFKLPILISYNTKTLISKTGVINIDAPIKPLMIQYNFGEGSEGVEVGRSSKGYLKVGDNSSITFRGNCNLRKGISIRCERGKLELGDNFYANKHCFILCKESITIGKDVVLGWNVEIKDDDGHRIIDLSSDRNKISEQSSIKIGNHVWLAAHVKIMKNVNIPSNSIVGSNSYVIKPFYEENILIAGYPANIKKQNIDWEL